MMKRIIAEYIGYPLQDFARNTKILDTLKLLRESQYWDETRLYEYRLGKLVKLLEFACKNVPYYENIFKSLRLKPADFKKLDDLSKIPVLTKEVARRESVNLVTRGLNKKYVKKGKTGGTTGSPLIVYRDTDTRSFTWASYYRWYEWIGIKYSDRCATLWGARTVLSQSVKSKIIDSLSDYLQNSISVNSFQMGENDLPAIYSRIQRFKPVIISGYLSAILQLARYIDDNSLVHVSPRVLSSTAETLLPHHREYLKKVFGAPIYDQYGCGELSAISYECPMHNGLHINQEHMICEVLDDNNNNVFDQKGKVVGTDLDNYAMPFIRYENGDIASLYSSVCSCGVNQPLMSSVDGRSADTITLSSGSSVHGVFLTDLLYELNILTDSVSRFQAIQTIPGQLKLMLETHVSVDKSILKLLDNKLRKFFNE